MIVYTAIVDGVRKYFVNSMGFKTEVDFATFCKLKEGVK